MPLRHHEDEGAKLLRNEIFSTNLDDARSDGEGEGVLRPEIPDTSDSLATGILP
jgi:hypothetical protein